MARYIISTGDSIERTDTYAVRVRLADGGVFENLEPRRLFPFTDPDNYITLLDADEKEVAVIKSLNGLDGESRKAIDGCFEDFYMIPVITQVLSVDEKFGTLKWRVMTDRGEVEFSIRNRHSDIKMLDGSRLIVRDSNDNRYQSDISKLDKLSMKKIYSYL